MILVDDGRTRLQFREVADNRILVDVRTTPATALRRALAEQLRFRDQAQARFAQFHPGVERGNSDSDLCVAGQKLSPTRIRRGFDAVGAEQFEHRLATPVRLGDEQHATGKTLQKLVDLPKRFRGAAVDRQFDRGPGIETADRGIVDKVEPGDVHLGVLRDPCVDVLEGQEYFFRRENRTFGIVTELFIARRDGRHERFRAGFDLLIDDEQRARRQVVEQRIEPVEKQRQVVFDTRRRETFRDILVHRTRRRQPVESEAPVALKARNRLGIQWRFTCRHEAQGGYRIERTLGLGIEQAQGFYFLIEQVDAKRLLRTHGKDVDQRAAHGEITVVHHLRYMAVTGLDEAQLQRIAIEPITDFQLERLSREPGARDDPMHQCGNGHDQDAALQIR